GGQDGRGERSHPERATPAEETLRIAEQKGDVTGQLVQNRCVLPSVTVEVAGRDRHRTRPGLELGTREKRLRGGSAPSRRRSEPGGADEDQDACGTTTNQATPCGWRRPPGSAWSPKYTVN